MSTVDYSVYNFPVTQQIPVLIVLKPISNPNGNPSSDPNPNFDPNPNPRLNPNPYLTLTLTQASNPNDN